MAAAALAGFILLVLLLFLKRFSLRINQMIKAFIVSVLEKTFFNGSIRGHTVAYLKYSSTFSIAVLLALNRDDVPLTLEEGFPIVLVGLMPFGAVLVLEFYRKRLNTAAMKARIGMLYTDIHFTRNKWTIYYLPMFLLRRFLFVTVPILIVDNQII